MYKYVKVTSSRGFQIYTTMIQPVTVNKRFTRQSGDSHTSI